MTTQTKQLVEAANALINAIKKLHPFLAMDDPKEKQLAITYENCNNAISELTSVFEQSESSSRQHENDESDKTKTGIWRKWDSKPDLSYNEAAYGAMLEYAHQQTADKDKQLQVQQSHIDDQDQLIFEQDKEITELKEAISELIQVKDWKDKHGKDEHYLKAMPIAWENVRKLIQK